MIALRALAAASEAQDAAFGHHEPWLDDAKRDVLTLNVAS